MLESFVDKCIRREASLDQVDDYIDAWHQYDTSQESELHESLAHRREAPRCNEVQRRDDRRVTDISRWRRRFAIRVLHLSGSMPRKLTNKPAKSRVE